MLVVVTLLKSLEQRFCLHRAIEKLKKFKEVEVAFGKNLDYFYKNLYEKVDILKTYYLLGEIELISSLINDDFYSRMNKSGKEILEDKKRNLN